MQQVKKFITADGTEFTNKQEALIHEAKIILQENLFTIFKAVFIQEAAARNEQLDLEYITHIVNDIANNAQTIHKSLDEFMGNINSKKKRSKKAPEVTGQPPVANQQRPLPTAPMTIQAQNPGAIPDNILPPGITRDQLEGN